ncbi:MAG TPA: 16S rRNA (adenine(1518)-N(6)/adenine(1519)-N(6))-dimethyltransferase RsmA [Epsilonproteobacteria bacterium]|nr:16S rRNA (adenine(1518)-N(6)/adenine(1519)-N(6))-dimethyltransferase RsmA [Campylobacterota bacterium]
MNSDLAKFANKKFGQNFLKDESYIDKIIQSMPNNDTLRVVEIGPGLGDLTKVLVQNKNVVAFEIDKRLCEHLSLTFKQEILEKKLLINCGDVLTYWQKGELLNEPYHLIANLPYYIATPIILKALEDTQCQSILVMVQKEVAKKFAANPKEKEFSALSVLASTVGTAKICFEVPPEAFVPQPKVTSAVLMIDKNRSWQSKEFEQFLRHAFAQPRKKLMSNLSSAIDKERVKEVFIKLGIPDNIRPHEITTDDYHKIYLNLKDYFDGK